MWKEQVWFVAFSLVREEVSSGSREGEGEKQKQNDFPVNPLSNEDNRGIYVYILEQRALSSGSLRNSAFSPAKG